jgi:HPt (histidine-containing phosphotransfer) domain-containing protein
MREHAAKCNWGMLERVTHNIKGMSSSLYVNDVYEKAAEFNSLLKINQTENVNVYIEEITQLLKNAEIEIKEYFL